MKKMRHKVSAMAAQERRREEVAFLYLFEEYSVEEIVEYSVYSMKTIKRDIEYIDAHRGEFLS